MYTRRRADDFIKLEIIDAAQLVHEVFERDTRKDLFLAVVQRGRQSRPDLARAFQAYPHENSSADDERALDPWLAPHAVAGMINIAKEFEQIFGVKVRKFADGFPRGPFSATDDKRDLIKLCQCALKRFLTKCNKSHPADPHASPYSVLVLIIVNEVNHNARCPITGLRFDWSFAKHHPLTPTLIAHCQHRRTGRFGLSTKLPRSVLE